MNEGFTKYTPSSGIPELRQAIADSWPNSLDDSAARAEWGWSPRYDLPSMTADMMGAATRMHLDRDARRVFVGPHEIDPPLSLPQYRLLELLVDAKGAVCTRDQVVRAVWPDAISEGVSEQAIDALVRRLRDRISEIDPDHQYIITVRGHGFRLDLG